MPERTPQELVELRNAAMNTQDWDALEALTHPEYVEEYPQSGERIRGRANVRAILENYPGGLVKGRVHSSAVYGAEDRWLVAPNFSVVRVTGTGDVYTAVISANYPDDSHWFIVSLFRMTDGMTRSATTYFAPDFPAPDWRAGFVERVDG